MGKADPIFGEVEYRYGWVKPLTLSFWDKDHLVLCVASAYQGRDIVDIQREQYQHFMSHLSENTAIICDAAASYYRREIVKTNAADISGHVKPTEIIFQRDGRCGVLFDCDWDPEHGIVVCVYPEVKVGPQDIFL
jgi:hypothetical protein